MKYIHVIINSPYTWPFVEIIQKEFNKDEHVFYIIRGFPETKIPIENKYNVYVINKMSNIYNGFRLIWHLNKSKKVFLHGLYTPYLVFILFLQPWLLKKSSWYIWGGELQIYLKRNKNIFTKVEHFCRKTIIRNFSKILTPIIGDYIYAKQLYNLKGKCEEVTYSTSFKFSEIDKLILKRNFDKKDSDEISILIGNSADINNNHEKILTLLEKYKDKKIKLYSLLSYGDKEYAKKIIEYGDKIFHDKFVSITDFMKYEDFVLFINKMDILIFDQKRQQGMGNLYLAIYLKKKIYINNENPLWNYFNENHIPVYNTSTIGNINYEDFIKMNNNELMKSSLKVKELMSMERIIQLWDKQFDA